MTTTVPRVTDAAPSRYARPRRRAAVLSLVLAALLVLALGIALGRRSVEQQPNRGSATGQAEPESSTTQQPPASSQTPEGAVAAATQYVLALNSRDFVADPTRRAEIIRALALPEQRDRLAAAASAGTAPPPPGDLTAAATGPVDATAWRMVPVGYRLLDGDRTDAVVDVWAVQVVAGVGSVNVPASALWSTTTVRLRWLENAWRIDLERTRAVLGPTPGPGPVPQSSDLEVIAADIAFEEYTDAAR